MIVVMTTNLSFLVTYHYVPEMAERRTPHREAHIAWLRAGAEAGHLVLAGALQDPVDTGVLIFQAGDAHAVRRLLVDDPYAAANLIVGTSIRQIALVVGG
jgi:uncharacterized protein YciI